MHRDVLTYSSNTSVHAHSNAPLEYCVEFHVNNVTVEHGTESIFHEYMQYTCTVIFTNITVHTNSDDSIYIQ